jgi:hypothetical protein
MIVFLSDKAYNNLCKTCTQRKLHLLVEWLSNQRFKDTRPEDFTDGDFIRESLKLPLIWYLDIELRRKRNIKITDDTLARLAAIAIIFKINKPKDFVINFYQTPLQLASYALEAIGQKNLTPVEAFPTFYRSRIAKKEIKYKEIMW